MAHNESLGIGVGDGGRTVVLGVWAGDSSARDLGRHASSWSHPRPAESQTRGWAQQSASSQGFPAGNAGTGSGSRTMGSGSWGCLAVD